METTLSSNSPKTVPSATSLWAGRIVSGLCIAFLLFDAVAKIIKEAHATSGSVALGIPEHTIRGIGITLLVCTALYAVPRTAIWGAILLTGYLGGAVAVMLKAGQPVYFALGFGVLVWLGLYLTQVKVRRLLS
jgi:hypothetical protein